MVPVEVCRGTDRVVVILVFGLDELQNKPLDTLKPDRKDSSEVCADGKLGVVGWW